MPDRSNAKTALEELRTSDRGSIPAELTETYEQVLKHVKTLRADLEAAAETDDQYTEQLGTPEDWNEDDWEDQLAEARAQAMCDCGHPPLFEHSDG